MGFQSGWVALSSSGTGGRFVYNKKAGDWMFIKQEGLLPILEKALDFSQRRQEIILNNMANVDTPGFKRRDISFADMLSDKQKKAKESKPAIELKHSNEGHMEKIARRGQSRKGNEGMVRLDRNRVDIEVESAEMAGNAMYYVTVSKIIGSHFGMLERIISQGGRT